MATISPRPLGLQSSHGLWGTLGYMGRPAICPELSPERGADVCIAESLCCTEEMNTTLYINYTPININENTQ